MHSIAVAKGESVLRLLPETGEISNRTHYNSSSSVSYCFTEIDGTAAVQHCSAELAGEI